MLGEQMIAKKVCRLLHTCMYMAVMVMMHGRLIDYEIDHGYLSCQVQLCIFLNEGGGHMEDRYCRVPQPQNENNKNTTPNGNLNMWLID